jgi:hypothetical protein
LTRLFFRKRARSADPDKPSFTDSRQFVICDRRFSFSRMAFEAKYFDALVDSILS